MYLLEILLKLFPDCHKNKTVIVLQKQFTLKLRHAITVSNSQDSTLAYMKGDFDCTSKNGKPNTILTNQGTVYTVLSRDKSRDNLMLENFEPEHIKVNTSALQKILRIREEALFSCYHHVLEISGTREALSYLQSRNSHIQHFMSKSVFL